MKKTNHRFHSLLLALACCASSFAQQALFNANDIVSPQINDNGTVTFSLAAPNASQVQLTGDFLPNVKVKTPMGEIEQPKVETMTRDARGVWSFTTSTPLSPELYSYKFRVDGLDMLDPSNVYMCRDIASYTNIFITTSQKGDKGSLYSVNDVAHGDVSKVWYNSPKLKMQRRMTIYTPAGYDQGATYPVLYLLHGAGGDEDAWVTLGRTAQILDNLIAAGRVKPMIVVMPNGNPNCAAAPGEWHKGMYKPSFMGHTEGKAVATVEESFPDIVKYVESHYRVYRDKQHRAICGLSMGGGHAYTVSKMYPDMFDYVGLFSAAVTLSKDFKLENTDTDATKVDPAIARQLETQFAARPLLYWIAIGNTDFLYKSNEIYRKYLDSKGYKYEYVESDGGHIWRNWRIYLTTFAQRLF